MDQLTQKLTAWATQYGVRLLMGLAVFLIGKWLAAWARKLIENSMRKAKSDPTLITFVGHLSYILMMAVIIIAALGAIGIQTTSLVAILGAAGLAVGLALQGSLANFAAGVLLVLFRPFKVGDLIEGAGVLGKVEELQIFTTKLLTPDNKTVYVPNAKLSGGNIINYSAEATRRVDLVVGISYDDDIRKAKEVLLDVLKQDERVLDDPAPTVAVSELADSSVNLVVRPWVKSEDYWDVYFAVTEAAKLKLEEAGITIPYPQQDVHLHHAGD